MWTIGILVVCTLALGLGAWLFFLWSVKSGQYDDPEGPKYRMLEDDDEKAGPAEEAPRSGADEKRVDGPHRSE